MDYALGLSDLERAIRKCTDSEFQEITQFDYPNVLNLMRGSFEISRAMNYLLCRIFSQPEQSPVRVYKCLDLASYLLIRGHKDIEEFFKPYKANFKVLIDMKFEESIYSSYMRDKAQRVYDLLTKPDELKEMRKSVLNWNNQDNSNSPLDSPLNRPKNKFKKPFDQASIRALNTNVNHQYNFNQINNTDFDQTLHNPANKPVQSPQFKSPVVNSQAAHGKGTLFDYIGSKSKNEAVEEKVDDDLDLFGINEMNSNGHNEIAPANINNDCNDLIKF